MERNNKDQSFEQIDKTQVKTKIDRMLKCLFGQREANCKLCKNCEDVDACCFIMDAVYICHRQERNKSRQDLK